MKEVKEILPIFGIAVVGFIAVALIGKIALPFALGVLVVFAAIRGWNQHKSGEQTYNRDTGQWELTGNLVPYWKTWGGAVSIILFLALIGVIISMINEK